MQPRPVRGFSFVGYHMRASPEQIGQLLAHAAASPHAEVCGLLLECGRVWLAQNVAANPAGEFEISAEDWAAAQQLGRIAGIWHSHPQGGAAPSMIDRAMCERTALPWHIVSAPDGDYQLLQPCGWLAPYEGRPYCYGIFDCWELARDWQARERGHLLPRLDDAPDGWWLEKDLVPALCQQAGLVPVAGDLQPGDIILMRCDHRSIGSDHAAVFIGDGRMLHQVRDQASRVCLYGGYWQRATTHRLRIPQ